MILYTLTPPEMIFTNDNQEVSQQKMYHLDGIPLLVESDAEGAYRVVRVMSSDPAHYLDERCTPGAKISFL
ncbi:YlzJ-like family protein [Robertmurraya korlensis]|uniref:YlzJ-like family protein n=1 Tax=Robertmurraya korlensis TaxID=519977 RepID=UPI00203C4278|nr:YlzJ-like family protein [Robertmurraya korlensis]MCM3600131.1 YlzJ-like family protein [Robertmurraya korlensis]